MRRQNGSQLRKCSRTVSPPRGPPMRSSTSATGKNGGGGSGTRIASASLGGWWTPRMASGSSLSYGGLRGSSISRAVRTEIWNTISFSSSWWPLARHLIRAACTGAGWLLRLHEEEFRNSRVFLFSVFFSCMFRVGQEFWGRGPCTGKAS